MNVKKQSSVETEQVWERWVEEHPYDADADERTKAMLLDTFAGRALMLRVEAETMSEPFRGVALRLVDDLDARMARVRDEGLRAALRATW